MDQHTIDELLRCIADNLEVDSVFLGTQNASVAFYPLIDKIAELSGQSPDTVGERFNDIQSKVI